MLIAPLLRSDPKQCPKKSAEAALFRFFSCFGTFSIYSTTKVLPSREILYVEAYAYESQHTGILAPAGEIRLSYQQCTEFGAQLLCQSFWTAMLERGGCRVNRGVMEQICSGPSEIQFFKTNLTFHFGLGVVKSYGLSFGNSRQGGGGGCVPSLPPHFFFFNLLFSSHLLLLLLRHS